ncbi:MAG: hypothetical protein JWO50_586 [Candidatus Kaiserbacteria bacterium]|nr:hypothetical protein [Candidatus Kaiserbacteria bacterium]
MKVLVLDHRAGCMPLEPCIACRLVGHLRNSMTLEAFQVYQALLSEASDILPDEHVEDAMTNEGVHVLDLSITTTNKLEQNNIVTVSDLLKKTRSDLHAAGFSSYIIGAICKRLKDRNLYLRP